MKHESKSLKSTLSYETAMQITSQAEADEFFEHLVDSMVEISGKTKKEQIKIQRNNLGYFAGYYDDATRIRVEKLFKCSHPIFGSIEKNGAPTPEQALKMGMKLGKQIRKKKV